MDEALRNESLGGKPGLVIVALAVALIPFTATLDYGLGAGSRFRMLPPILLWLAMAWTFAGRRGTRTRQSSTRWSSVEVALAAFVAMSVLSMIHAVWALDRDPVAQAVGFAVVAAHAAFFWLARGFGGFRGEGWRTVLRVFVVAMLVAGIAGLVQRVLLEAGVCVATREIPARLENRCFVGGALTYAPDLGRIRLPGTAASPWHWSWLLVAGAACAPALFADRRWRWRIVGGVTLLILLVCSFVSGQRVALVLVPLVGVMAGLAALRINGRKLTIAGGVLAMLALASLALPPVRSAWADLEDRWRASPPASFVIDQFRWAVRERPELLGHGPGAATSAARHFDDIVLVESVPAKRLFELGWLGFLAWYAAVLLICVDLMRRWRSMGPAARAIGVYVVLLAVIPWWHPVDTDPGNLLFWLFAGMLRQPQT